MAASASAELDFEDEDDDADEEAVVDEEEATLDELAELEALDDEPAGAQANRHVHATSATMTVAANFFDMISSQNEMRVFASLPDLQLVDIAPIAGNCPRYEELETLFAGLGIGEAERLVHERAVHPHGEAVIYPTLVGMAL